MHLLVMQQRTPKHLLSHHPMLVRLPPVVPHADVAVRSHPCQTPMIRHPMFSGRQHAPERRRQIGATPSGVEPTSRRSLACVAATPLVAGPPTSSSTTA